MAAYNRDGELLSAAYDMNGAGLLQAYDIDGNPLLGDVDLTVMTYNVQWFTNFNGQQTMQEEIIDTNAADIIGLQELTQNGVINAVGLSVLHNYAERYVSNHKNYLGLVSNLHVSNVTAADFQHQDPYDASQYGETRAYIMGDLEVNGKAVKWINTHLCLHDAEIKAQQMMEVFALAELAEYCIITGDFNFQALSTSDADYSAMYKPFVDAGYHLANGTARAGFTKTWTDSASATSTAQMLYALDNIIVSGNIDLLGVKYDTTKFDYLNGQSIDHIPIICKLRLN